MTVHKRFTEDGETNGGSETMANNNDQENAVAVTERSLNSQAASRKPYRSGKSRKTTASQVRSLQRLLRNKGDKMPKGARKAKEDELAALLRLAKEQTRRTHERDIAKRYHMVRFFERRKLERILNRMAAAKNGGDADARQGVERDLRYVVAFPKGRKYVALFPHGGHSAESRARVDAIRLEIDTAATGTAATATVAQIPAQGRDKEAQQDGAQEEEQVAEQRDDFFLADGDE